MKRLIIFAVASIFLVSTAAFADTLTVTDVWGYGGSGYAPYGVYIGPYEFTYQPTGGSAQTVWLICDDYFDHIVLGQTFDVNVVDQSGGTAGQVGWLGKQLIAYSKYASAPANESIAAAIQYAIWNLSSGLPLDDLFTGLTGDQTPQYWIDAAKGENVPIVEYETTPSGGGQNQFTIAPDPPLTMSVQEPSLIIMLGIGLLTVSTSAVWCKNI